MPMVRIHVLAGHPRSDVRRLMANTTAVVTTVLETELDRVHLWVDELDPALRLIRGRPAADLLAIADIRAVDAPIVEVDLLSGRPSEVIHHLQRELTEGVVRALGVAREGVRVIVREIPADQWAIGGLPSTIRHAAAEVERLASHRA